MMGEQGRGLSGGQKQRILIARALYKDPDYLFFDEATNALDTINEQKIVSALDNVFKNKTVVVVAHRLSTIRKADQIVVMQDGFVTEVGSHDRLMKLKNRYFQLVQSQLDLSAPILKTESAAPENTPALTLKMRPLMNNKQSANHVAVQSSHFGTDRTEEVRDIIERMPSGFGLRVTAIVLFLFVTMIAFGWLIRYPDIIRGKLTVNTPVAPIKLVANAAGKIRLNDISSQSDVKSGDVVAWIENATSYDTLRMIRQILTGFDPNNARNTTILSRLPATASLGTLTTKYYVFLASLHQMSNFINDQLYDKQIMALQDLHKHQVSEITFSSERIGINTRSLEYSGKFLKRDSLLFAGKVAAEAELDRTSMSYLSSRAGVSMAYSSQIDAKKQAQQTMSRIAEITVQKSEKQKELEIGLLAAYNDLVDNITLWEQRYLFRSPFEGKLQFLKFWTDNQYVQEQEPVFAVVPTDRSPYGQVTLPAFGAGKVQIGQEVIVKLDDYPYNEYGSITGTVHAISLTTNTERTNQGDIETYLVTVHFPTGLITNYGKQIAFRHESKGEAEIITHDRRLIERLFDNLKYALNK